MADRRSGAERSLFVDRAGDWRWFGDGGCTEWPTAGQHHGTRLDERGIAQNAIAISFNLQIRLVTAGRIQVLPASPGASLDLVPIDHVIGRLTNIVERMAAASGRTFHLVSGAPVPVAALRTLALGYPRLHAPRFVPPQPSNGPG